jgi:ketosteroid isomerase-like protein
MQMTGEEELIQRYFDAFNRHDIEGVMACFHAEPVLIGAGGSGARVAQTCGVHTKANSPRFLTDVAIYGCVLETTGAASPNRFSTAPTHTAAKLKRSCAEVMEIVDGKIKEIRDYHQPVQAKAA